MQTNDFNPSICHTYEKQRKLHQNCANKLFRICTYRRCSCNPFRIRTYKKQGVGLIMVN